MKRYVRPAFVLVASLVFLACGKREPEFPSASSREVILVTLSYASKYVDRVDVTGYEEGKDAIGLYYECQSFYYPWNGEDTIRCFTRPGFLYVDSQRVGLDLVYFTDDSSRLPLLDTLDLSRIVTVYARDSVPLNILNRLTGLKLLSINLNYDSECSAIFGTRARRGMDLGIIPAQVALYVDASNPSHRDIERLASLENLRGLRIGGRTKDDDLGPLGEMENLRILTFFAADNITNRGLRHLAGLTQLRELDISFSRVGDAGMKRLAGLSGLRKLNLVNVKISDAGLSQLGKLRNLRELHISNYYPLTFRELRDYYSEICSSGKPRWTGIFSSSYDRRRFMDDLDAVFMARPTAQGWKCLSSLADLRSLNLGHYTLDENSLAALAELKNLEFIYLYECEIDNLGLRHLALLPHLGLLDFNRANVADTGLYYLSQLDSLSSLTLFNPSISNRGLRHLPGFKNLWGLHFGWAGNILEGRPPAIALDDSAFYYISQMPNLRNLSFYRFDSPLTPIDNHGLRHLKRMPYLTSLSLNWRMVNDTGLASVRELSGLKYLSIHSMDITNQDLRLLSPMQNLKGLALSGIEVDREGIRNLARLRGLQYLSFSGHFATQDTIFLRRALAACYIEAYVCDD